MHNTTYLDFDLLIEPGLRTDDAVRDVYRARVLNSPARAFKSIPVNE